MGNRTFTIIKPNAVAVGNTGKILDAIVQGGFKVRALKMTCMSKNDAERFYGEHCGKPFFDNLVLFMTSGPIVVAVLEGKGGDTVAEFRKLVGNTNPAKAEEGTLRKRFGESLGRNSVHASDSDGNARLEWSYFFTDAEIMVTDYRLPISPEELDA